MKVKIPTPQPGASSVPSPATGDSSVWGASSSSRALDFRDSGGDLAFAVYAMQLQQLDSFIRASLDEVQQIHKLRSAINQQLTELRNWKAHIAQYGSGDGDSKKVPLLDWAPDETKAQIVQKDFSIGKDGSVTTVDGPAIGKPTTQTVLDRDGVFRSHNYHEVTMADIDKEINRLQGIAQGWDSDREIKMIMMNQHLNKKEQAVTQLTNFLKKAHDTQSAVINNLK